MKNVMTRLVRIGTMALLFSLLVPSSLVGQTGERQTKRAVAEAKWQTLQAQELPPAELRQSLDTAASLSERRLGNDSLTAHFLAVADQARAFQTEYAEDEKYAAAQALEARNLLRAALNGNVSRQARAAQLVEAVKHDFTIPVRERLSLVAMSEYLLLRDLARDGLDTPTVRAESARYLIREFPGEPEGYSALLSAAVATKDVGKIKAVTQEIVESGAPFRATAEARITAGRYDLLGKSLADVANTALGRDNFFEKTRGRKVILYTWRSGDAGGLTAIRQLIGWTSDKCLVIGIYLDGGSAPAEAATLPGEQYRWDGPGCMLALLLKLNAAPLVYLTDERGVIVDVDAQHELAKALTSRGGNR